MSKILRVVTVLFTFLAPSAAFASSSALRYGAACQEAYENAWLDTFAGAFTGCSNFLSQLSQIGGSSQRFYWNLQGNGPRAFEDGWDANSKVEDADIAFLTTHSGAWTEFGADFAGWKDPGDFYYSACQTGNQSCGVSSRMRLGDENTGLSILAMAGCTSLSPTTATAGQPDPLLPSQIRHYGAYEDLWPRWDNAFRGGLRIATGTWDVIWFSNVANIGNKFGLYMRQGNTITEAWRRAMLESDANNDPAVMATGSSAANCTSRLYNMTISNFDVGNTNRRLRDNAITHSCWHRWW